MGNRARLRRLVIAGLLIVAATATGCALALHPPAVVGGRAFDRDALPALTAGLSPEQVEARLGPPATRRISGANAFWSYEMIYQLKGCSELLFYVIPVSSPPRVTYTAVLEFGPAGLQRTTYVERDGQKTTSRVLLEP